MSAASRLVSTLFSTPGNRTFHRRSSHRRHVILLSLLFALTAIAGAALQSDIEFAKVDGVSLKMDAWVPEIRYVEGQTPAQYEIYALKDAPHWLVKWENHPEWAGYKQKVPDWLKQQMK